MAAGGTHDLKTATLKRPNDILRLERRQPCHAATETVTSRTRALPISRGISSCRSRRLSKTRAIASRHCEGFLFRFSSCDDFGKRRYVHKKPAFVRFKDDGECVIFVHGDDPVVSFIAVIILHTSKSAS